MCGWVPVELCATQRNVCASFELVAYHRIHPIVPGAGFDGCMHVDVTVVSRAISVASVQWGLVVIWLLFPEGSYGGLWLTGAFIVLALIAGAKLHIIAMHLSRHAYSRFYRPYSRKPSKLELTNVSESNVRDSPTSHKHAAGPVAEGVEGQGDGPDKTSDAEGTLVAPEAASSTRVPLRRLVRGHSQRIKGTAEDEDLFKLFWFRTPRHMLRIFRCVAALYAHA